MALANWMTSGRVPEIEESSVRVQGHLMRYQTAGTGAPLMLIHGIVGSCLSWRRNLLPLAMHSRVYAPDLLGLGKSDRVPGLNADLHATAERMFEFLNAVGLEKVDLLGTSHGGTVAMLMAALHPERVNRLILVAPANPFSDASDPLVRFYCSPLGRWFAPRVPSMPRHLQEIALGRLYGNASRIADGTLDLYMDPLRVPGTAEHVVNILAHWFDDMKLLAGVMQNLKPIPTLLLWGDRDRAVTMSSCFELNNRLPKSQVRVLRNVGHLPYEEAPDEFNAAVGDFLNTTEAVRVQPGASRVLPFKRREPAA